MRHLWPFAALLFAFALCAQDNHEIQACGSETVAPWSLGISPIIDKELSAPRRCRDAPCHLAFNPALDRSFPGSGIGQRVTCCPNFKVGNDLAKRIIARWKDDGALGVLVGFDPLYGRRFGRGRA